jgi:hypothetical protein
MDVAKAASRLRSLAADSAKRSKTAVLREVFVDIEAAIRAGVSQVVIVEELRALGLDINSGSFRSALRRLRAESPGRNSAWSSAPASTDFAPALVAEHPSFVRTTSAGSIYDAGALYRLVRASSSRTDYAG